VENFFTKVVHSGKNLRNSGYSLYILENTYETKHSLQNKKIMKKENQNLKDWDPRDYQGRSRQKVKNNEDISFWALAAGAMLLLLSLLLS